MSCRPAGSRVPRVLSASVAAVLLLPALLVARQNKAIDRSLPEIKQLLSEVQENQKRLESVVDQYSCTENEEVRELDKNGRVKKTIVKEYEDFYLGGVLVRREVKKDGKPLAPDEQKKEDGRIEKRIREYEKRKEQGGEEAAQRNEKIDVSTILRSSNFTHPRWEHFRGHDVIVFDFAPNPDYRPRNKTEDLLHKLEGTLWVDESARQVVRLEAHLSDTLKLAGGLLASIRRGSSLVMEQAKMNNEVWLPSYVEAHFSARVLLLAGALGNYTSNFSDYKKFRVETVSGSSKSRN